MIGFERPQFLAKQVVAQMSTPNLDSKKRAQMVAETFKQVKDNPEALSAVTNHIGIQVQVNRELDGNPALQNTGTIREVQNLWSQFVA